MRKDPKEVEPLSNASDAERSKHAAAIHERLLSVGGFLGGISFTALVLILQSSNSSLEPSGWGIWGVVYFNALIMLVGGVSVAFIMASVASVSLAAGTVASTVKGAKQLRKQDDLAFLCFILGWFGLLVAIPLLLLPFFWVASLVVGILETILLYRFVTL